MFHLGAERDHSIYDGTGVVRVPLDEAHAVLCTGLFDDLNDQLEDYDGLLADMKRRGLTMICANPDKIVRKGDRILYCAGKLAELYAALGGEVLMAGKPFAPIYDLAMAEASRITGGCSSARRCWPSATGPKPTSAVPRTMALRHFLLQKE